MRILVAEDDPNKIRRVSELLAELRPGAEITQKRSYQSSLREALETRPDLIVLDMSMPNFDQSPNEPGGRFRHYAGRDILKQIKRKAIPSRVVVLTQYESFGEGNEVTTLEELETQLENEFSGLYVGTVFYRPSETSWRDELTGLVERLTGQSDAEVP